MACQKCRRCATTTPCSTRSTWPRGRGKVHYLAPECELTQYGESIDVWAFRVIAYQLTYGHNPFKFRVNPWRVGRANEKLRPDFVRSYEDAISKMEADYQHALQSPREGYIHREYLVAGVQHCAHRSRLPMQLPPPFPGVGGGWPYEAYAPPSWAWLVCV